MRNYLKIINDKNDTIVNSIYYEYKELFLSVNRLEGENLDTIYSNYIMSLLYDNGKVLAFRHNGVIFYTSYLTVEYDYRALPKKVRPVYTMLEKGLDSRITTQTFTVDKDCVIGYFLNSKQPVATLMRYYINKIIAIDSAIDFNRNQTKVPWVFGYPENSKDIASLINNNIEGGKYIFSMPLKLEEINNYKAISLPVNYNIDKLQVQREKYESKIKTLMGVDNVNFEKQERLVTGEVDANNEEIEAFGEAQRENIKDFCNKVKTILGENISYKIKKPPKTEGPEEPEKEDEDNDI